MFDNGSLRVFLHHFDPIPPAAPGSVAAAPPRRRPGTLGSDWARSCGRRRPRAAQKDWRVSTEAWGVHLKRSGAFRFVMVPRVPSYMSSILLHIVSSLSRIHFGEAGIPFWTSISIIHSSRWNKNPYRSKHRNWDCILELFGSVYTFSGIWSDGHVMTCA